LDPETSVDGKLMAFDICVYNEGELDENLTRRNKNDPVDDLIRSLSEIISYIGASPLAKTQLYCFSSYEVTALNEILVYKSLESDDSEEVRACIGAIVDIPLVLMSEVQPELLGNSLHHTWTKASRLQLEQHLKDLGLDTSGSLPILKERLQLALSTGASLRRLPKVVSLDKAISDLVAMAGPGYTTMQSCANHFFGFCSIVTDDELYELAKRDDMMLGVKLHSRNRATYRIIRELRRFISCLGEIDRILVNDATPLNPSYPVYCQDENLRKLIFMHEVSYFTRHC
jgi:hypothetical protein